MRSRLDTNRRRGFEIAIAIYLRDAVKWVLHLSTGRETQASLP
jgi:hypothetical protein